MSRFVSANTSWFIFKGQDGSYSVYSFTGEEAVNKPYAFSIELVSRSANEDIIPLLGTKAVLRIADKSGGTRLVHGLIREMEQLHTANRFTHYRCVLVPRIWFLDQIIDHRIFQNLPVNEIIDKLLKEKGFGADDYAFKLCYTYEPREYCVQYGETDLHFITRLCEEEGIYFYFEHKEDSHCLCFCDREGGPKIPGESEPRFYPGSGNVADTAVISRLSLKTRVNSNASTYREWNFEKPKLDLEARKAEPEPQRAPVPPGMKLEQYRYPHLYQLQKEGKRYAELQLSRQLTFATWIECESDISRLLPGHTFTIHSHPRADVNTGWWTVAVYHHGEQPGVLEHEAPDGRGLHYSSSVVAIPEMTRFVPELEHPKDRVEGVQSAIVTGPEGEEVFTDEYGRVKVQFHWDREGAYDEKTSCWVRVTDSWAGEDFGFIQAPRIGQEVMVEYMEGDPDRPVITGRVYNRLKMPPWELPGQKTLSGIQSREFHAGRRNQLVFDDTQGEIQAQLSSDHNLSQLNLGYLTRVNHHEGRKDFRGEGFELRTDGWGAVRAAKGLYIGTDARSKGERHHTDIGEATGNLQGGETQHTSQAQLAVMHNAQESVDQENVSKALTNQNEQIHGSGEQGELTAPHIVISSPTGLATTTLESTHMHNGKNMGITAGKYFSLASGKSILGTALERISLFAHKMGIKMFAGEGKIEIQAQSDALDIIAEKVVRIISAQEKIILAAPEEIELTAGGNYMKLNKNGIEMGTGKKFVVHAAAHSFAGPKSATPGNCPLPSGMINDEQFVALDMKGNPFPGMPYTITDESGAIISEGITDLNGLTPRIYSIQEKKLKVNWLISKLCSDDKQNVD